jgi:ribosome-associated toxin RatA of RatAB toxin-antitoxin module
LNFQEARKLEGGPAEVWKRVSAVEEIPKYWHGTRSLVVVGGNEGKVHARVRFGFGGSGEADISKDEEKRALTIDYRSGPFTGKQIVVVGDESITATWDVKFRGIFRVTSKWNEGHFRSGTVHALERLVSGDKSDDVASQIINRRQPWSD